MLFSFLYPHRGRRFCLTGSYHHQDHKTRGYISKNHRRLGIGLVLLTILVFLVHHIMTTAHTKENHRRLLQSFCRRYSSLCEEQEQQQQEEKIATTLEHQALTYPTSRIHYDTLIPNTTWSELPVHGALYMTVRNEELQKVRETMRSFEDRFNHRWHYPWILLCREGFTEDFIQYTSSLVSGPIYYGKIDPEAFIYPSWINIDKVKSSLMDEMGHDLSTFQMMRYQSGLFYHHSLFNNVKYAWRIDPGMTFSCTMVDPFEKMTRQNKSYGFAATRRYQDQKTTEKIWRMTSSYMDYAKSIGIPPLTPQKTLMQAMVDQHGYTSCHIWSLFEILDIDFLKSAPSQRFFEYMDHNGVFFYEKLTDSVYRTMVVAMYLTTDQIEFFNEIGFKKEGYISHCPLHLDHMRQCACDIKGNDIFDVGSCSIQFLKYIDPLSIKETAKFIMQKSSNKSP